MTGFTSRTSKQHKKIITWLTLLFFSLQPILTAAQAVADPNAPANNRPVMDSAQNGTPVVQIAAPSAAGVSRNLYQQFDIERNGLILNNSLTLTKTQLAGYIQGNPYLNGRNARIILNEVTGNNISRLGGYLEVAGQRADVIIANRNGIAGNGFGFINTGRGVLTTGTPVFGGNGSLEAFRVTTGQIAVEGDGINGAGADRVDLISRAVRVNAGIWANELNAVTGSNQVDYGTLNTQTITGEDAQPLVALDVSALGGMYANKIKLVGTEHGLGVNSQGTLSASSGSLTLTNDGKITLAGDVKAGGNININATDDITNQSTLFAQDSATIGTTGALTNSGIIAATNDTSLAAQTIASTGTLAAGIQADGQVGAGGNLTVTATDSLTATGSNLAGGKLALTGNTIDLSGANTYAGSAATVTATNGDIHHSGATLTAGGALTMTASGAITNDKDANNVAGQITAGQVTLTANDIANKGGSILQTGTGATSLTATNILDNTGGTVASNGTDVTLAAKNIINDQGTIGHAGAGALNIQTTEDITNRNGVITGNGQANIQARHTDNTQGTLFAQQQLHVNAGTVTNNQGTLASGDKIILTAQGAIANQAGLIQSEKGLSLQAQSLNNQNGTILNLDESNTDITTSNDLQNTDGKIASNGSVNLAAKNLTNNGEITALGSLAVTANQNLDNTAGTLHARDDMTLTAGTVHNTRGSVTAGNSLSITATAVDNTSGTVSTVNDLTVNTQRLDGSGGQAAAGRDVTLNSTGDFTQGAGSQVKANRNVVVTATGTLTNQGTITAVGDATLTANKITNDTTGTVAAGANLTAAAAEAVNNNGRMDGNVVKADSKAVTNTGTVTAGTLTVNADTITNAGDAAMLASTGDTTLNAKNAVENKDGATIYSMGNITIAGSDRRDADGQPVDKANSVLNQSATIQAEKDITIHAKDITNKKRVFAVGQTVTSDVTYSNIIYNLYYPTMTMGEDEPIGDTIQIGINPNSAVLVGYERTDNFLANYYGHVDFQTLFGPMYIFATWMIGQNVKETTFTQDSPEGKISSGKNIYLRANTINNNTSSIIAANTLDAIGTVNNTSQGRVREITRHLVDTDRAYYTYDYVTYSGYRVYDVTTYEQLPGYTSIFSGGQQVNITGPNVSNITKNPENVTGGNSSTLIPLKQTAPATNVLSSNTLTTIPSNKLYTIHTEPGSKYLIETDPRFANYGTFITSDYMLDQLHVEPDKTMKQIGDGFYQQKLIRDQIAELTGRQFLDPNSSTQEEYKALMDNGVAYANKFNLQVGVALTAEQMAQLTSNMVWMVEQEVQGQKVLVPVVYLAPNQNSSLQDSGAIIAGKDVKITVDQDIVNQNGKITGENINLVAGRDIKNETTTYVAQTGNKSIDLTFDYDHSKTGNDLRTIAGQTAEISATGNVTVNAGRDVNIAGGKVSSDKDIAIDAGRNLNVSSVVTGDTTTAKDYLKDSTVNVTSGINAKGNIAMTSQQDANLSGAQVSAGQDLTLKSVDGNVNISAVKDEEILDVKTGTSRNWKRTRTDDETVIGSNLQAGGNVNITAKSDSNVPNPNGGNITVAGSNIYSDTGKITLDADKNVTVQEVTEKHESLVQTHKKKSGFLSSKTTDTLDYSLVNEVQGSTISGDSVSINSGKDLTVKASNVVATNDVNLTAANDANIIAAQETGKDEHYSRTKKSGLFSGGGLGFTIGSQTQTTTLNEQVKDEIGSTVGSVAGNVNITAGNNVKSEGALITSGQDTNITGKNVTIDNTTNIYDSQYKYEFKQSGLTVSLGGGAVDAGMNVAGDINRAGDVKDDRLAALYDYKAVQDIKTLGKELKASDGFSVNVSIGSSKTTIEQNTHVETVNTSNITAGGDVTIKGTDGDVNLKATNINANDVTLEAAKNLNIGSDKNVTQIDNKTSSSSSSIGASIGLTTGALNAIGGVSTSKGTENQAATTHTESVITASGTATLKSGDDTNIIGSQVKGEKVVADIGGNLNIESQQDSETFNSKNKSTGIGLDTSKSSVANGSNNTTQINSNFESVVEQAGIYAGKGGFEIDVEKNTDLKAGVISSKAEAVKNALRTGSLTFSNMENKAKYNASSKGNNYSLGKDGKFTGSPTPSMPANGSADNTTEAAISPGTIEVRNDPNQDLSNLSRNPEAALNALGKIFDKKTVQEQQELANVFGQVAFKAIGDLAENMRKNAKTDQEKAKWAEGGEYKVLLHAVAGGLMSQLAGNGFSSGAAGAGLSQALQGQLANITDPGVRLLISSLFGEIAAEIVHGDAQAGASAAYAGTKYNDLTHRPTTKGSVLYAKSEEDGLYHFYVVDSNGGEVELKGSPKAGQVYWDERDSYERVQLADGSNSYFTWKYVDGIRVAADDYGNAIIVNGNPVINPSDLASSPILGYYVQSQYASAYSNARMFSLLNVDANASSNLNLVAAEVEKQREMEKEIQDSVLSSIGGGSKFQKLSQSSISHLGKHTASEFVQQVPYLSDEALSRILAKNSFFNPSWSKEQIIAATEEAYNALRSKGLTGLQSYIVNGETIKVFIKPDGTYDSAYGVYKLTMEFFGR